MTEFILHNLPDLETFRKELRNCSTPAEVKLWMYLRDKQLEGRKFRRQHSFGCYILDFYCPSERLAIELDGQPHFEAEAIEYDRERDLFLKHFDVLVLRFVNHWIFENPEGVLNHIRERFGWFEKKRNACGG